MTSEYTDRLDAFRQLSQKKLTKILNGISGMKDVIIEASLMKPLERFIGVNILRSRGVNKIFKLDKKGAACESPSVLYIIRGDLITGKRVCDQINSVGPDRQYHIINVPQVFHSMEALLEEEGLYGRVTLHSLSWELIQLDTSLFSLESPEIFKHYFVSRDPTFSVPVSKSIWALQHICGKVPFKMYLGSFAKSLHNTISILDKEKGEPDEHETDIGFMFIVDRDVDYASALLVPGTYSGLVADVIGINTGAVEIPKDDGKGSTMIFNSKDETYEEIKHRYFSDVIVHLKHKIGDFYNDQSKRNNMSLQEMKDFVKNDLSKTANQGRILSQHLHICEEVNKKIGHLFEGIQACQHDILTGMSRRECITFIEDILATSKDMNLALRLIALLSICQNGLTSAEASSLKMQFFHAYGFEHLTTFHNLEKMGLFTTNTATSSIDIPKNLANKVVQAVSLPRRGAFQSTAAKLGLFPDSDKDYSVTKPQDMGYVFGGLYIPLIAQVVRLIIKNEKSLRDLIRCLPGEGSEAHIVGPKLDSTPVINPRSICVYVLGGITYAEVAAFALLEKETGYRIVCCGSSIMNGNNVVQSAI